MQERRGRTQDFGALSGAYRAQVAHAITVEVRLDLLVKVAGVLHDAADDESSSRAPRDVDGNGGALVGVDPTERHQRVARARRKFQGSQIDAVMNRGHVVELGGAVRLGDGDEMAAASAEVRGQDFSA